MSSRQANRGLLYLLIGLLTLVWGGHWIVLKIGVGFLPPFTYSSLRVITAEVTLGFYLVSRGELSRPSRHDIPIVVGVGLGQMAAQMGLVTFALQFLPAGRSALLLYTMPLWVAVIQTIALRKRPARRELLALILGIVGIVILFHPGAIDWGVPGAASGVALVLLSSILWAATILQVQRHRWHGSIANLTFWELLIALGPLLVLAIVTESSVVKRWQPETVALLLFSGPLATGFAFWASQSVQRALSPMATAIGFLAVPITGFILGGIILFEPIAPMDVVGILVVCCGVAAIHVGGKAFNR